MSGEARRRAEEIVREVWGSPHPPKWIVDAMLRFADERLEMAAEEFTELGLSASVVIVRSYKSTPPPPPDELLREQQLIERTRKKAYEEGVAEGRRCERESVYCVVPGNPEREQRLERALREILADWEKDQRTPCAHMVFLMGKQLRDALQEHGSTSSTVEGPP